ncbi:MAG TPA: LON peptidase substrate-binding domain-containing protein [Bacteroidota bacterium]|nr:LON peptidase substrate-binding domain-containing protein [Bacteroidota bacterium]
MSASTLRQLPLFPLKVVLFPGSALPLHIFEERYRTLVRECIEGQMEFGINFFEDDKIDPVGCTALVKDVLKEYDDGRLDISVEGRSRYTLVRTIESDSPYFVGEVVMLDDKPEKINYGSRRRAIEFYNRFVEVAFRGTVPQVNVATSDTRVSFLLVQKAGLELKDRQKFLGMDSENERLNLLNRHFESMLPLISTREKVERLVVNDGYLPPSKSSP